MDNTFSWNNHIDLLMEKLITTCCIIINTKTCMSASSLKLIYHASFHSATSYGTIFWGKSSHSSIILRIQRKVIRIMKGCGNRVLCGHLFNKLQILPLKSQYTLSLLMFVVKKPFLHKHLIS
jgi:hypothetical protein